MRRYITLIIPIIVLIGSVWIVNYYLKLNKYKESETLNSESINLLKVSYNSIFNTFKLTAQLHYTTLMNNQKVLKLLKEFKDEKDEDKKSILRGQLYRILAKKYKKLKKLGIRQFHFHTHKGESLLRFHKPSKSGDSLVGIRKSITYVNDKLQPFFGFEGGKIFPGFRFVFPIFNKGEHLGSVEFSLPFDIIETQLQNVLPIMGYQLHLNQSISYNLVFDTFRSFFQPSPILPQHYIENPTISQVEQKLMNNRIIQKLHTKFKPKISLKDIQEGRDFTLQHICNHKGFRANFIAIKELNGNHAAYLVSYEEFDELVVIEKKYLIYQVLIYQVASIILLLIIIIYRQFNTIITQNSNIQQLINTQDNIVILTDGRKINFANLKFLNFFGFKDIEAFKKEHNCICDYFLHNDKFFHLGKVSNNQNWIESIQMLAPAKRIVSMQSHNGAIHAFSVTINHFDDHFRVITFNDISQTMSEYIELEEKLMHDKLTYAFNREYFDQNYTHSTTN